MHRVKTIMTSNVGETAEEKYDLFDDGVVFRFFSKSKDMAPGKGTGETIEPQMIADFKELDQIKNWRHMLSNFWICEMKIDGLKWASVEHFYQASKFRKNCPVFYRKFSLSYKSDKDELRWVKNLPAGMTTNPAIAKALGGKSGKYKRVLYRPSNVVLDDGFFNKGHSADVMEIGQTAKYEQNEELRKVLLATKYAKLVHISRGIPPTTFNDTMRIRKRLQNEQ